MLKSLSDSVSVWSYTLWQRVTNEFIFAEPSWLENCQVNLRAAERGAALLSARPNGAEKQRSRLEWAIKALTLTDLTTLAGDDTNSNVERLCLQAVHPFTSELLAQYQKSQNDVTLVHTAAVCVYPSRVQDAFGMLSKLGKVNEVKIAAVATGFPSGQYSLASRLVEIDYAIKSGATEIDIVLDRSLVLTGQWESVYEELVAMRKACGETVHMKAILAIGECGSMENVYKASMAAMMAGSDFIKTSTGKESVNATLPVGLVMIRAIQEFRRLTGIDIGLKPAGGVRTVDDAIAWMHLIQNTLGDQWLEPSLFRFGASGLLDNIVTVVTQELANQSVGTDLKSEINATYAKLGKLAALRSVRAVVNPFMDPKLTVLEQVTNYRKQESA